MRKTTKDCHIRQCYLSIYYIHDVCLDCRMITMSYLKSEVIELGSVLVIFWCCNCSTTIFFFKQSNCSWAICFHSHFQSQLHQLVWSANSAENPLRLGWTSTLGGANQVQPAFLGGNRWISHQEDATGTVQYGTEVCFLLPYKFFTCTFFVCF